jgi:hypothetical protein
MCGPGLKLRQPRVKVRLTPRNRQRAEALRIAVWMAAFE